MSLATICRLLVNCSYEAPSAAPDSELHEKDAGDLISRLEKIEIILFQSPFQGQGVATSMTSLGAVSASKLPFNPVSPTSAEIESLLISNVVRILREKQISARRVVIEYFRTIHPWLPIISISQYATLLETDDHLKYTSGLALLILSMFLVTAAPSGLEDADSYANSTLYRTCKTQFSLFLSLGGSGVQFVQAGLLVALSEHMQGLPDQAYITLGICARTASA
ncbi:hypothetical protein BBP40_004233 [Aspergillus hancockii]|nr:hypothetical protein BBP40_004233 [Aspergillus hancockii]